MEHILEILIILAIVAIALAFLARRFVLKRKAGNDGCGSGCGCSKPDLPAHLKKAK